MATKTKTPVSKRTKAQKVFNRMYPQVIAGKKTRADVIAKIELAAELSNNGAKTYYQTMKKEAELNA